MCDPIRSHPFPRASTVAVVAPRCCIHTSPYLRRLSDGGSTLQRRLPRPTMPQLPHLRRKTHLKLTHTQTPCPSPPPPPPNRRARVTSLFYTQNTRSRHLHLRRSTSTSFTSQDILRDKVTFKQEGVVPLLSGLRLCAPAPSLSPVFGLRTLARRGRGRVSALGLALGLALLCSGTHAAGRLGGRDSLLRASYVVVGVSVRRRFNGQRPHRNRPF